MNERRQLHEVDEIPIVAPEVTLGWRMQMALDHGHRSVEYMALACGVSRSTISRWINDGGKRPPRRGDLEIWARQCRVPLSWLAPSPELDGPQPTVGYLARYLAAVRDEPTPSTVRLSLVAC